MDQVRYFADQCDPDYLCEADVANHVRFENVDLDIEGGPGGGQNVMLKIRGRGVTENGEQEETRYLFTDWARDQLLKHLGTREKWFQSVTRDQQAAELTERVHTFATHKLRLMRSEEPTVRIVRGLLSAAYAQITDVSIMDAISSIAPDGRILPISGKTDRALYCYCVANDKLIGVRDGLHGYPGFVIKNSEVGFTSLWVIPALMMVSSTGRAIRPLVLAKESTLKRVHRGSVKDLTVDFENAIKQLAGVWGPLEKKFDALKNTVFQDEDAAVAFLREQLIALRVALMNVQASERAYRAKRHIVHNALEVLQAVAEAGGTTNLDTKYDQAELAGALLLRLLRS